MIRRNDEYASEIRKEMRSGKGEVKVERLWACGTELKADTRMFGRLTLQPGCSIGYHEHQGEEEVFYILSGHALVDDNGTKSEVSAGDTILTGGAGHSIENIGQEPLVLLAVISRWKQQ